MQVVLYKKLARVSVILYKFLACNCAQLYFTTETLPHIAQTVLRDWPAVVIIFVDIRDIIRYQFSFDKILRWMEQWEIGVSVDFIHKKTFAYDPSEADAASTFNFFCHFACARNCDKNHNLCQISHASFLYKMTCTSYWFKFQERVSPALLWHYDVVTRWRCCRLARLANSVMSILWT